MAVAPHEVDGVAPDWLDLRHLDLSRFEDRAAQNRETQSAGHRLLAPLVVAKRTGALLAESIEAVDALMSVLPADMHFVFLSTDADLFGVCGY
jgi:hypothetical protein